jgi:hypothetical protein
MITDKLGSYGAAKKEIMPDRGREGFRLPSLRTVRAVLPHTALQSLVSTSGVSRCFPGSVQGEESWFREEGARLP